jgi:signal transduction histidine kinase
MGLASVGVAFLVVLIVERWWSANAALAAIAALALIASLVLFWRERAARRRGVEASAALATARREAEDSNKAMSRLLATAGHDMRQPLHAMTLYVSVLEGRLQSDAERELLANIDSAAQSMGRLFTSLLDCTRLEAGLLQCEVTEFSLGDLLAEVAAHSAEAGERDGARVCVAPAAVYVRTDPDLLEIILRNLTSSAVKHAKGGRVLLGCRRVGAQVRIEVHDAGRTPAADGPDLGLSIAQRIARLLDHTLSVKSKPGRGSVFSIVVPRGRRRWVV